MRILNRVGFMLCVLVAVAGTGSIHGQGAEFSFHGGQAVEEYERGGGGSMVVNLPTGIRTVHIGARATYHVVTTQDEGEKSLLLYGVDTGVTLVSSPLLVRVMLGVGRAQDSEQKVIRDEDTRTVTTTTTNTLYAQPGVLVGASLGLAFVGIEGRYINLEKGVSTAAIYAMVGFKVGR